MAQHYKNEDITKARVRVFLGWDHFNPKGNVAPGRMDQNLCGRLWTCHDRKAVKLSVASPAKQLRAPSPEYLESLEYREARIGESFGPTFSTHVFRLNIAVPASMHNQPIHLLWDSNSEALVLSEKGNPMQGLVGGDHWARRADYPLFPDRPHGVGHSGETIILYIEISCNGLFGAGRGGDIEPPQRDRCFELEECCLAIFDSSAWDLIHDVTLLSGLAEHLPEGPRRARALQTANEVVNAVEVGTKSTYESGRRIAAKFLDCRNGSSQSRVYSMLHSHIDLAWLWPMASTPSKGVRTFATQLRLLERFPDSIFVQSQAQLYDWVKSSYPSLWEEVCKRVREGRFVPVGGSWVEMDCNIPSGESLIRQFVVGQAFFQRNFGLRCKEFWLPDTFGYCGQLPQIMRGCGIDYFLTQKLSWNLFNKFPHSTFVWEGLDGSQVLAHMPPADTYNAQAFPEEVMRTANKNKDAAVHNSAIMLVGHGDGGGGASPAMLESMKRMHDLDGVPKVEFSTPEKFFEGVKSKQHDLPRWVGELYFELHRGTYTNQARTKQSNRQCENALRDLELVGTIAVLASRRTGKEFSYPASTLAECWKLVLKNCFHDTLPGSCIGEVYEETTRDYALVTGECTLEIEKAVTSISEAFTATYSNGDSRAAKRLKTQATERESLSHDQHSFNTVLLHRSAACKPQNDLPVVFEAKQSPDFFFSSGVGVQTTRMSAVTCYPENASTTNKKPLVRSIVAVKSRPSGLGITLQPELLDAEEIKKSIEPATVACQEENGQMRYVLANRFVKATISATGHMSSLILLDESGRHREALVQTAGKAKSEIDGGNRLVLYDDVSQFWCAWDTEVYSFEKKSVIGNAVGCEVVDEGPLRVSLHFTYPSTEAGTTVRQLVSLRAESTRVDFRTDVDWKESRKILRVLFNTRVKAPFASYNSQFGFVRRPTTFNHSWEIAKFEAVGHQYCDLSEHQFGIALLNDCKYGYSVRDNTMRLSLLRASKSPDDSADMGMHRMTYSILPHWESFPTRTVLDEAADLNWPPLLNQVRHACAGARLYNFSQTFEMVVTGPSRGLDTVVISAIKQAEQAEQQTNNVVVRMYEAMGARGLAQLSCPSGLTVSTVQECNMLEDTVSMSTGTLSVAESTQGSCVIGVPFTPFQIRTIMLTLAVRE